jgi:hypothetical protein
MGLFGIFKGIQSEKQAGLKEKMGIRYSDDSDTRCVECLYIGKQTQSSSRDCRLHGVVVETNQICAKFKRK